MATIGKPEGYNRHITNKGRRPHKGISSLPPECLTDLAKRLEWELGRLIAYQKRVGQYPTKKSMVTSEDTPVPLQEQQVK